MAAGYMLNGSIKDAGFQPTQKIKKKTDPITSIFRKTGENCSHGITQFDNKVHLIALTLMRLDGTIHQSDKLGATPQTWHVKINGPWLIRWFILKTPEE